jgi:hypothetical protein
MSSTEHHLEHAEHAQHTVHDPFNRRVAVTMAIVAAVLACVTLLSHRAHTETLRTQSLASDEWNHYQAKKNRLYLYEALAEMERVEALDAKKGTAAIEKAGLLASDWQGKVERYTKEADEIGEKAKGHEEQSHHSHEQADRFDLGELSVEIALVLCSVAVLTRLRGFWYSGVGFGLLGALVAASGFLVH